MKIDRLVSIIMLLLERERMSAQALASMFEVSTRTIYRDLETINQAGIPILTTTGPTGGAEILRTYKVEKRLFSKSDLSMLLIGLESIKHNVPSNNVSHALSKIESLIPAEQQQEYAFRANQIHIDASPWIHTGDLSNTIALIKSAMDACMQIQFQYRSPKRETQARQVDPYRLLYKGENWYLQGFCHTRNDFRTFKLLRMQQLRITSTPFQIREFPAQMLNQMPKYNPHLVPATLRVHEEILDHIIVRFGADCLTPDGPEYYIAEVNMPTDLLSAQYLLGFGTHCVCLAPPHMRDTMRALTQEILHLYAQDEPPEASQASL